MYYANINSENKLVGIGLNAMIADEYGSTNVKNIEVTEEVYNNAQLYGVNYYKYSKNKIVLNPDYDAETLEKAKAQKYEEAKTKAYVFLESGEALYEFEPGKHIEATDGNIGKFTAYALGFMAGSTAPVVWSTKEDETVTLNAEQVTNILQGLGAVQAQVWTVEFTNYVTAIQEASTVEEVNAITIDYEEHN